jgi:hypothetical protein
MLTLETLLFFQTAACLSEKDSGFASTVISAHGETGMFSSRNDSRSSHWPGESMVGVPPPKYRVDASDFSPRNAR